SLALRLDPTAVQLDQRLGQRKAHAKSSLTPRDRLVDLCEHLEYTGELLGRDADSRVADPYDGLLALAFRLERDRAAVLGVLRGVLENIREDLGQAGKIRLQVDRLLRHGHAKLLLAGRDRGPSGFHRARDRRLEKNSLCLKDDLSGRDPAHIEEIIEK